MVNKEILDLKEIFFKELREMESSIKKNFLEISSNLDKKNKEQEEKINLTYQKNEQLYEKMIYQKTNLEKIGKIDISQKKLNDMLLSQEIKIQELSSSNQRLIVNYDKIITENLTVPGFIGSSCVYQNLCEYIKHNINEIEKIKIEKEAERKMFEDIKHKIDGLMKNILNLIDNSVIRCHKYTDNKQKYIEEMAQNKLVEISEKNMDFRTQVLTNLNNMNQQIKNFEKQIQDLVVLKSTVKSEIDDFLNDFYQKCKKEEKNLKVYLGNFNKIKTEITQMFTEVKSNKKETQTQIKQNKYFKRKSTKIITTINRPYKDRLDLNTDNSKNIIEETNENKFNSRRKMEKKKTQILKLKNNLRLSEKISKINENDDSLESGFSQKLNFENISNENENENLLINDNIKEEDKNTIFEEKEYSKTEKKQNEKKNIFEGDKEKNKKQKQVNFESQKEKVEFDFFKENKEKLKEKEKENYIIEKQENFEIRILEKSEPKSEGAQKIKKEINLIYNQGSNKQIKNKENINISTIKNNFNHKEINNYLFESKENLQNIIQNIKIPDLINKEIKNKNNNLTIKTKIKGSRNLSFTNNDQLSKKHDLNKANNLKKDIKIRNNKNEIETANISYHSNSNSNIFKNESNQIDSNRIMLNSTNPKFHLREKNMESLKGQTDKKDIKITFPKIYFNFKLINLGENINFNNRIVQNLENPLDKEKKINNINIDFSSPLTNIYKEYKKKTKDKKNNNRNSHNLKLNTFSENNRNKLNLKGESVKLPNFKNNTSNTNINFNNNKKNFQINQNNNVV